MATRIYKVTTKSADGDIFALVDATSPHQARTHVAKKFIVVEIAKPRDIIDLMKKGKEVEAAASDE